MQVKYDNHRDAWSRVLGDVKRGDAPEQWFAAGSLDGWRQRRVLARIKPLVEFDPGASWLTVGDGRFGADARFLAECGAGRVHATDLHDELLSEAAAQGLIGEWSRQNAERLAFEDGAFDYVLCKESFHHFPRPFVALEEMFRVARLGVVLVEPRDHAIDRAPLSPVFSLVKRVLGSGAVTDYQFEPVGNFIYTVSEREIEKFLLGRHQRYVAFSGINDFHPPVRKDRLMKGDSDRSRWRKTRLAIRFNNLLAVIGLRRSRLLCAALFKEAPVPALRNAMCGAGWTMRVLPDNPYLA